MQKKLRAGIIGLGKQNVKDHIPAILQSTRAQIVAVCDVSKEKTEKEAAKLGVKGYTKYREMIEKEKLDFVIVAVPHNIYRPIVETCAKKGVHIIKEKPFAVNLNEANYFKQIAEENNIYLTTMVQRRFNPIYQTFFQLQEHIGKPFFVDINYNLFIEDCHDGWRGKIEQAGGGCIIDMGYHMIDMIIWYFGLPDKVQAEYSHSAKPEEQYDAEDTACITFSYENGFYGVLKLSRFNPPKTEHIRLIGDKAFIDVERGIIRRCKNNGEILEELQRKDSWDIAMTDQINTFAKMISKEKEQYLGSPEYHLQHVAFVEACYRSKRESRSINPKELLLTRGTPETAIKQQKVYA